MFNTFSTKVIGLGIHVRQLCIIVNVNRTCKYDNLDVLYLKKNLYFRKLCFNNFRSNFRSFFESSNCAFNDDLSEKADRSAVPE